MQRAACVLKLKSSRFRGFINLLVLLQKGCHLNAFLNAVGSYDGEIHVKLSITAAFLVLVHMSTINFKKSIFDGSRGFQ
jgi:hypothetical protein